MDENLTQVFNNILNKNYTLNITTKAARWKEKVEKYHHKPELMIGSHVLYRFGEVCDEFKNSINWFKAANLSYIEQRCKKTVKSLEDPAVFQGVVNYLSTPFNPEHSMERVAADVIYYVVKEKITRFVSNVYNTSKAYAHVFCIHPFKTRLGLRRATLVARPASSVA